MCQQFLCKSADATALFQLGESAKYFIKIKVITAQFHLHVIELSTNNAGVTDVVLDVKQKKSWSTTGVPS